MAKLLATLGAAALLGACALTNPASSAHARALVSRDPALGVAAGALLVTGSTRYHDLLFFSSVTVNRKPVTVGVLGHVFVLTKMLTKI